MPGASDLLSIHYHDPIVIEALRKKYGVIEVFHSHPVAITNDENRESPVQKAGLFYWEMKSPKPGKFEAEASLEPLSSWHRYCTNEAKRCSMRGLRLGLKFSSIIFSSVFVSTTTFAEQLEREGPEIKVSDIRPFKLTTTFFEATGREGVTNIKAEGFDLTPTPDELYPKYQQFFDTLENELKKNSDLSKLVLEIAKYRDQIVNAVDYMKQNGSRQLSQIGPKYGSEGFLDAELQIAIMHLRDNHSVWPIVYLSEDNARKGHPFDDPKKYYYFQKPFVLSEIKEIPMDAVAEGLTGLRDTLKPLAESVEELRKKAEEELTKYRVSQSIFKDLTNRMFKFSFICSTNQVRTNSSLSQKFNIDDIFSEPLTNSPPKK